MSRAIGVVAGLVLLGAVVMKLLSPDDFLAAVMFALAPIHDPEPRVAQAAAALTVATEAMLGIALVLGARRGTYIAASLLFVFFSLVLATRFSGPAAPPCACLGRLFGPGKSSVWIDIVRNVALAGALLLALPAAPARLPAEPTEGGRGSAASRAFTLVEVLVVVLVTGVLLGLLLPAIASARRAAKHTQSTIVSRQIATVLRAYGSDNRDYFPAFANLGSGTSGPVSVRGQTFMVGYFRAHVVLWPAAVSAGDSTILPSIRHPMLRDVPVDPDHPETEETHFLLTAAVAAAPELFKTTTPYPFDMALIGARKWSDVTYPSDKGLILDGYWWSQKKNWVNLAAFCDGSAGVLADVPNRPLSPIPEDGPRAPVISTVDGLHGRDR